MKQYISEKKKLLELLGLQSNSKGNTISTGNDNRNDSYASNKYKLGYNFEKAKQEDNSLPIRASERDLTLFYTKTVTAVARRASPNDR